MVADGICHWTKQGVLKWSYLVTYLFICSWPGPILTGAAQRVFLSSNNTSPCYNTTIDLICHYPTLMERVNGQYRYSVTTASWRANGSLLRIDGKKYSLRDINQTASQLTVSMKRAFFPGSPVSFTCYLLLTGGGEDSTTLIVYPQATAVPPILGNPVFDGNIIKLSWDHTDKGPCYNHLTFFYNITWYPADEQRESATSSVDATEHVIIVSPKHQFQVMILGLSASHPPVYTSPVDLRIETKGLCACGNDTISVDGDATSAGTSVPVLDIAVPASSVMAAVSCVANLLLVTTVIVLSVKCHHLKYQVKEQQKCIENSPTQGSDEIELQTNPSYVTVGAVQIQ